MNSTVFPLLCTSLLLNTRGKARTYFFEKSQLQSSCCARSKSMKEIARTFKRKPSNFLPAFQFTIVHWIFRVSSTLLLTNQKAADQSSFKPMLSLVKRSVEGRNFIIQGRFYISAIEETKMVHFGKFLL